MWQTLSWDTSHAFSLVQKITLRCWYFNYDFTKEETEDPEMKGLSQGCTHSELVSGEAKSPPQLALPADLGPTKQQGWHFCVTTHPSSPTAAGSQAGQPTHGGCWAPPAASWHTAQLELHPLYLTSCSALLPALHHHKLALHLCCSPPATSPASIYHLVLCTRNTNKLWELKKNQPRIWNHFLTLTTYTRWCIQILFFRL